MTAASGSVAWTRRRAVWHDRQRGRDLAERGYGLRLPHSDAPELVMDILRHGQSVEPVPPRALRPGCGLDRSGGLGP